MFKFVFLVFLFVVSHTAFALSNSKSLSNHYLNSTNTPANSLLANNEYSNEIRVKTINQGHYIGGGVASLFLGFGIGHAIQGRWKERGWIHTILQSVSVLAITGTFIFFVLSDNLDSFINDPYRGIPVGSFIIGTAAMLNTGSRIWEMIDVWILPDSIKIISQKHNFHKSSPLQQYKTKMPYSVALQWQF